MHFFAVWAFPTLARLLQLFGGNIHPIISILSGCFISSQGFFNAMIYFRPRYTKCTKRQWWEKVWAIIKSTLLFCCNWEDYTNDTKDLLEEDDRTNTFSVVGRMTHFLQRTFASRKMTTSSNCNGETNLTSINVGEVSSTGVDVKHVRFESTVLDGTDNNVKVKMLMAGEIMDEKQKEDTWDVDKV